MNENIDVLKNNKNDLTTDKITQMMENKYNQFIIGVQQPILHLVKKDLLLILILLKIIIMILKIIKKKLTNK